MANTAYLRYSQRVASQKTGGRYDLQEIWIIDGINNTGGGDDDPSDSWQNEALSADGLPELGDSSQDGGYICVSISPRSQADQGTAYVDVRYVEDPLTLVTEVNDFGASKTKPAWRGIASVPGELPDDTSVEEDGDTVNDIRNSAGDRYNPPVTYDCPLERIEVTFRSSLSWYYGIVWNDYVKHWNESDFEIIQKDPDNDDNTASTTYPAGSLMLVDKRAPLIKEPYFHKLVTLIFLYDPDLWGSRLPDMGPRCKYYFVASPGSPGWTQVFYDPVNQALTGPVRDARGVAFAGPAELDGAGGQLTTGDDGKMNPAVIYQWWPVDDDNHLLRAEFDDLECFTPERTLNV